MGWSASFFAEIILHARPFFTRSQFAFQPSLQDSQQTQAPEEKIKKETDRQRTVLLQPVLRELPHGAPAPVQGLDWYKNSLLKDADGDCANDFLEEPQKHHMCDSSPALKRPHVASLQSNADKAVQNIAG